MRHYIIPQTEIIQFSSEKTMQQYNAFLGIAQASGGAATVTDGQGA